MAAIGQVTKLKDESYKGELKTLSIRADVRQPKWIFKLRGDRLNKLVDRARWVPSW